MSSYSSSIFPFLDPYGERWLGKADLGDEELSPLGTLTVLLKEGS